MTSTEVRIEDLRAIVAGSMEAPTEEVGDESDFAEDLGVDSLVQLEVAVRVEDAYGIPVDDTLACGVRTLVQLREWVAGRVAEGSAA